MNLRLEKFIPVLIDAACEEGVGGEGGAIVGAG